MTQAVQRGPRSCDFEMQVTGVYSITGGMTTFTGFVTPAEFLLIGSCECELRIDNVSVVRFRLGGEIIHKSPTGMRSVWTSEGVDFGLVNDSIGRCILKGIGEWYPT